MQQGGNSRYKWYILVLTMLTAAVITGVCRLCMPVLFKEISLDLDLTVLALGTVWGLDPLAGVFVSLPGGLLADRFGMKRTLTVICLLGGVFCALRGLSTGFGSLAATMFLFGIVAAMTQSIIPKITAVWFSGKNLGLANALLNITVSFGYMTGTMLSATVLSPWLGGWRHVLFFLGLPVMILGILWLVTGREPRANESVETAFHNAPVKQSISSVIRIKQIWILGLIQLAWWGTSTALEGYLPLYLRNIGWTGISADSTITALSAASMAGMLPMVMLANRLQSPKRILLLSLTAWTLLLILLPFVQGSLFFAVLIIGGFLMGGGPALCIMLLFSIKGVTSVHSGTALGLVGTLSMIGPFAAPPLGSSLADINQSLPILFWAGLSLISLPLFFFFREAKREEAKASPAISS
jgi:MFS family permease